MHWSVHQGIYFVEGRPSEFVPQGAVREEISGFLTQNQLKSLDDLKDKMARQAKQLGCNSVCDFKYGQRSTFWKSIFAMDDVHWYGSGVAGNIQPDRLPPR
jgi:hypothetical protein